MPIIKSNCKPMIYITVLVNLNYESTKHSPGASLNCQVEFGHSQQTVYFCSIHFQRFHCKYLSIQLGFWPQIPFLRKLLRPANNGHQDWDESLHMSLVLLRVSQFHYKSRCCWWWKWLRLAGSESKFSTPFRWSQKRCHPSQQLSIAQDDMFLLK